MDNNLGDLEALRQQILANRGTATRSLAAGYQTSAQKKRGGLSELAAIAAKKRADAIKISTITLREKLVKGLDEVMSRQLREFPEMEGKYFVGFIMGDEARAEVVDINSAANAVDGMTPDEARETLSANPVGYFAPDDFTMRTPDNEAYQTFQSRLNDYLKENSKVIRYLQSNPEQATLSDMVRRP